MKTTPKGQIQIIEHAKIIVSKFPNLPPELVKSMTDGLDDAISSIHKVEELERDLLEARERISDLEGAIQENNEAHDTY
jgi:hypothetical protein